MRKPEIIGELTMLSFGETSTHSVAWNHGYGVTCSSLFTSNGSLSVVARGLESYLDTARVRADDPSRQTSLVIDGKEVVPGQVESALKAACAAAAQQ